MGMIFLVCLMIIRDREDRVRNTEYMCDFTTDDDAGYRRTTSPQSVQSLHNRIGEGGEGLKSQQLEKQGQSSGRVTDRVFSSCLTYRTFQSFVMYVCLSVGGFFRQKGPLIGDIEGRGEEREGEGRGEKREGEERGEKERGE
jgi:hypothetical protein